MNISLGSTEAGKDGWIEWVRGAAEDQYMVGLSFSNWDASYASINYALHAQNNGTVAVYELGAVSTTLGRSLLPISSALPG